MTLAVAVAAFVVGVAIVILATQRLLEGLVGIAKAVRVAPFVASVVLSGVEAENIAVDLAAGEWRVRRERDSNPRALGGACGFQAGAAGVRGRPGKSRRVRNAGAVVHLSPRRGGSGRPRRCHRRCLVRHATAETARFSLRMEAPPYTGGK